MKKRLRRERETVIDAREVQALDVECRHCACRVAFSVDGGKLAQDARCPQCGETLEGWRGVVDTFRELTRATTMQGPDGAPVLLRVRRYVRALALLVCTAAPAHAAPDLVAFAVTAPATYGPTTDGYVAYSLATTVCNRGEQPAAWCDEESGCAPGDGSDAHPVIVLALYRLSVAGRMEQVGMSWARHGFFSTNAHTAGCLTRETGRPCQAPPYGSHQLGAGCTVTHTAALNAAQPQGRRSEVNATTGVMEWPGESPGPPYTATDQRLRVAVEDVDPELNPGARYFVEVQVVAADDAAAGNAFNNSSTRRVLIGAAPAYTMTLAPE